MQRNLLTIVSREQKLRVQSLMIKRNIIPLVVTYNPRHSIDFNLIKGLIENFESKHLQEVFKPFKIIKSSRQNPNLKRLLTIADFNSLQNYVSGITHCIIMKDVIFAKVIILFKETKFSSIPQENFYSQLHKLFHVKVAVLFIF